jgi:DNA-binding cell septation regulator SpoVG
MKLLEFRKKVNGGGSLKAFVDIEMNDGTIIREFRLLQENGKKPWIASPQLSWRDPADGTIKYKTVITLPSPIKTEIDTLILSHWFGMQEKLHGNPI